MAQIWSVSCQSAEPPAAPQGNGAQHQGTGAVSPGHTDGARTWLCLIPALSPGAPAAPVQSCASGFVLRAGAGPGRGAHWCWAPSHPPSPACSFCSCIVQFPSGVLVVRAGQKGAGCLSKERVFKLWSSTCSRLQLKLPKQAKTLLWSMINKRHSTALRFPGRCRGFWCTKCTELSADPCWEEGRASCSFPGWRAQASRALQRGVAQTGDVAASVCPVHIQAKYLDFGHCLQGPVN